MPQLQSESERHPIRPLSQHLANQIAAGEMVERPASIVKELLENSLDAGATRISISLSKGGMQGLSLQDNGCGIPVDELQLALAPHATSKIRSSEDLAVVESMGFRGEALASIASVSRLQLTSRWEGADGAWVLTGRHGEATPLPQPAAHPVGSTIEVQELFFNTPARRRFLRSERTEFRHCEDVVRRVAMSHFDVAIHFNHNQRTVFQLPVATDADARTQRLEKLCGKVFVSDSLVVDAAASGLQLRGWVGRAEAARPQADLQYFFVNGRIIRDRMVSHALRQAYADSLYPGRFPAYVLYLELAPDALDVNVHPTKHEVRFHQTRLVHDFLGSSLRQCLGPVSQSESLPYARQPLAFHQTAVPATTQSRSRSNVSGIAEKVRHYDNSSPSAVKAGVPAVSAHHLAVLHNQYLLFEHAQGLGLMDIARLQQALLLHQWQKQQTVDRRPLLIPVNLPVSEALAEWVVEQSDWLQSVGFDLELMGPGALMLRQIPLVLISAEVSIVVPTLLEALSESAAPAVPRLFELLTQLAAQHPAAGWQLSDMPPLMSGLDELTGGQPLRHPSVTMIEKEALQGLFKSK